MKHTAIRLGVAAVAAALLTACGGSSKTVREDFGFDGSKDVPFSLTVRTEAYDIAKDDSTLTTANGNKTAPLGDGDCSSEPNGDDAYPITIKGHIKNPVGDLNVAVNLSVKDPNGATLNIDSARSVTVAWMYKDEVVCQSTRDETISAELKGAKNGPDAQLQAYLILPGGVDNYDGYELNVTTDAGEVYNLKGGALPYKKTGVTVELAP